MSFSREQGADIVDEGRKADVMLQVQNMALGKNLVNALSATNDLNNNESLKIFHQSEIRI